MKYVKELADIYNQLDIVEGDMDLDVIKKARATLIMLKLRFFIAAMFKELEKLEE